jgi:thiol-disulfide isomerase/thioredoxin
MGPFRLEGLEGSLSWNPGAVGKVWLYLDFWASWCGPCRLSFPWMNRLHDQWSAKGLRIVAVTVDRKRDDALGFLKANPAKFEIAFDPQAAGPNAGRQDHAHEPAGGAGRPHCSPP